MNELESQKLSLQFELAKHKQDIKIKRKLMNKEVKQGFQMLVNRPRIYSDRKTIKTNTSTFITE